MIKYAKIQDEDTGSVNVAIGTDIEFYKSIGMAEMDVEQSEVNGQWYLANKCPHCSKILKILSRLDFAKALLELGIPYKTFKEVISNFPNAQMQWELCERVCRGDDFLNDDSFLDALGITPEQVDDIFTEKE